MKLSGVNTSERSDEETRCSSAMYGSELTFESIECDVC